MKIEFYYFSKSRKIDMSELLDDVIPIIQSFLSTKDFLYSRLVSSGWCQKHQELFDLVTWNSPS